jgi:hypothetical protein
MKTLKDKIFESSFSFSETEFDKSIKAPEKKKVQNAIYKQLEKTGTTGKFYRDDAWEGVGLVKKDIEDAFKNIKNAPHEYEVSIAPDDGGYRKSKDGMSQWKQYKVEIYVKGAEDPFMVGTLNCHAAGTVEDPFDMYDMSCCIGY